MFRETVRLALQERIPEIEGRVYEAAAVGASVEKPFITVLSGAQSEGTEWTGFQEIVVVGVYAERVTNMDLDPMVTAVRNALHQQLLPDEHGGFVCTWLNTSQEGLDETWNALFRLISFGIKAWIPEQETHDPGLGETWADETGWFNQYTLPGELRFEDSDPLEVFLWTFFGPPVYHEDYAVEALHLWTLRNRPDLSVYRGRWPRGYSWPSVLWRVAERRVRPLSAMFDTVTAVIRGHTLASSPQERESLAHELTTAISREIKIPGKDLRAYVTVLEGDVLMNTNPFSDGQIRLQMRYEALRPLQEVEPIREVTVAQSTGVRITIDKEGIRSGR